MELDRDLIAQAHRLIDGANVHDVTTWLCCYQLSKPNSSGRERYELLLRNFVTSKALLNAAKVVVEAQLGTSRT